jgi:hypothetical protein
MTLLLSLISLFSTFAFSENTVNLLQEEKVIQCSNENTNVLIHERDRFFSVNQKQFQSQEFLDKGILARNSSEWSLVHLVRPNQAFLIVGQLVNFIETDCRQVRASKVCESDNTPKVTWSPTGLVLNENQALPVQHYGVYPNDGTFFIAYDGQNGMALIDYGSKFQVLFGRSEILNCSYKE